MITLRQSLADTFGSTNHPAAEVARAAGSIARLDQVLARHPLRLAFLYRSRLDAVRRQSAADGQSIDPWHLSAILEGLRLRMDGALWVRDSGAIFEAARYAFKQHQWLTAPDAEEEDSVTRAANALAQSGRGQTPLLAAANGIHAWLDQGGERPPLRAALVRYWVREKLLRLPVPLTGAAALRPDTPWDVRSWVPEFLSALADEAEDGLLLLLEMERAWFSARQQVAGRRRHSRAGAAIDILAATPLVSAASLGGDLGMATNNASALLNEFQASGIVVEVTHRTKRRIFGLTALAPLRAGTEPPSRPLPGRGRGRPPVWKEDEPLPPVPETLAEPLTPMERRTFDYSDLEQWMANADRAIRQTQRVLAQIRNGGPERGS